MAAKLKSALGLDITLIADGKGIFDVSVDGQLVFSKYQTGSFPNETQLVDDIVSMVNTS